MPAVVRLNTENPDELLSTSAYGATASIELQSGAAETGPFTTVTTAQILAGVRTYVVNDLVGTPATWYRTRYRNTAETIVSDWSEAFQAGGEEGGLIASLYDVKQQLGSSATSTTDDEDLIEFIRQITSVIQGFTGRRFVRNPLSGTTTFLFDVVYRCRSLAVPKGIAEMSKLEVATETGGSFVEVPTGEWFLDPPETERDYGWPATSITLSPTSSHYFWAGKRTVRTTMAEGWTTIPLDVQAVAQRAVLSNFLSKGSGMAAGVASLGPDGAMRVLRGISPEDRGTLELYRIPLVG